jgi:hypothetical protein
VGWAIANRRFIQDLINTLQTTQSIHVVGDFGNGSRYSVTATFNAVKSLSSSRSVTNYAPTSRILATDRGIFAHILPGQLTRLFNITEMIISCDVFSIIFNN